MGFFYSVVSRLMNMQPDIIEYIDRVFQEEERDTARELVRSAVLHDGTAADPRCQRAALVGSRGSMRQLKYLVELLKMDYRDVLVSGEYEGRGRDLRRVRDLSLPFPASGG